MLTLYYKPSCPYCQAVLGEAEDMNISFDLKDISGDETLRQELIEKGGKQQVPYLVDSDRDVSMYESNDIITYLKEHYSSGASVSEFQGVRINRSDDTCDTCQ